MCFERRAESEKRWDDLLEGEASDWVSLMFGRSGKKAARAARLTGSYGAALGAPGTTDVSFAAIRGRTLPQIERSRSAWMALCMGVSNANDFNRDYHVSHQGGEGETARVYYKLWVAGVRPRFQAKRGRGISVFYNGPGGGRTLFHNVFGLRRGKTRLIPVEF